MRQDFLLALLFLLIIHQTFSHTIIIYITLVGKSHLDFVTTLVDKLTQRGHIVDLLISRMNTATPLKVSNKIRRWAEFSLPGENPWMTSSHLNNPFVEHEERLIDVDFLSFLYETTTLLCKESLHDDRITDFLREGNYDLAIASHYDFCPFVLLHAAGVDNVVTFTPTSMSFLQANTAGLPSPPSYIVDFFLGHGADMDLSLVEKTKNFIRRAHFEFFVYPAYLREVNSLTRAKFGGDFPSADLLSQKVSIMFVNTNELFEMPRPISHKIKYIGGINRRKPQQLTKEFDAILSSAQVGNVLFSFGTQVPSRNIPIQVKMSIIRAFSKFPMYNFLWKYDDEEEEVNLFDNAKNVYPMTWLPQTDLLHDKRVHAFISHLGLNSLLEATYAGVPLIAIPLFSDQRWNAILAKKRGIAVVLRRDQITEETITNALNSVLNNTRMKETSRDLSAMLNRKPESPENQFIDWVEYAAEFKNLHEHLSLQGAEMSMFTHYCIDVILALILLSIVFIFICLRVFRIGRGFYASFSEDKKVKAQ